MHEYLAAKKRIFMNQDASDYLVLNFDDPLIRPLSEEAKAKTIYFYKDKKLNPNQSAVLAVASILGIDREMALKVFRGFKGVEHRLEEVADISGIRFINDSKATTVDATIWALKNTPSPVILIAGGREKGNDYSLIRAIVKEKVKEVILIGEAKERIRDAFSGLFPIDSALSLEEAAVKAFKKAVPGDWVLFSPMCKSFDMFTDYEERGRVFKKAVYDLTREKIKHGT
jgi:UDP-N-acetylmuramoylalanine--D-glutamate ligase